MIEKHISKEERAQKEGLEIGSSGLDLLPLHVGKSKHATNWFFLSLSPLMRPC